MTTWPRNGNRRTQAEIEEEIRKFEEEHKEVLDRLYLKLKPIFEAEIEKIRKKKHRKSK